MPETSPVFSVIIRKFRKSDLDAANLVLARFEEALKSQPGFVGIQHNPPANRTEDTYSTVLVFSTLDHLIAWEQSEIRKTLVKELSAFIEGDVVRNRLWNLDALVDGKNFARPPKKWKTVSLLIFWVIVMGSALNWAADQISPDYPTDPLRRIGLAIVNILLNSYFFLPRSMALWVLLETRLFRKPQ